FPRSLSLDPSGNLWIGGRTDNNGSDFGGGPLPFGALTLELDPFGKHLFSRTYGKAYDTSVAVDSAGNAVYAGTFNNPVDLGAGLVTPAGSTDIFVVKVD